MQHQPKQAKSQVVTEMAIVYGCRQITVGKAYHDHGFGVCGMVFLQEVVKVALHVERKGQQFVDEQRTPDRLRQKFLFQEGLGAKKSLSGFFRRTTGQVRSNERAAGWVKQAVKQFCKTLFARAGFTVNHDVGPKRSVLQTLDDAKNASHVWMRVGHATESGNPRTKLGLARGFRQNFVSLHIFFR